VTPLKETLAAAILRAAKYSGEEPLVDPMCGSGTIAIAAALIAARIAPGRAVRGRRFGFERWPAFGDAERAEWQRQCAEADARALPKTPMQIIGADRDDTALVAARRNASACVPAVMNSITWHKADARELSPTDPPGVIFANPPYGERLGAGGGAGGLEGFWRAFGQRLRTLDGHAAFLLVPRGPAEKWIGMRPRWSRPLWNGPLEVVLCRYDFGKAC
jgi:putative N6-adenine-specific DNA methylase